MDEAVAEKCGLPGIHPTTNIRDAFQAASKIGMFDFGVYIVRVNGQWQLRNEGSFHVIGETLELAFCEAIMDPFESWRA